MDLDLGGGRRKNKTRKRKNKTKRRKKMKGGKKTKSKRKKKKSKTRRKRGGERDCKKILEEEKVCDRKSWMKASRKLHPDKGGDADKFRDMNECYKQNKDNLSCSEASEIDPSVPEKEEAPPTNVDPNEGVGTPQGATNETNEPKETNEDKEIKKSTKSDLKFDLTKVELPNGFKIIGPQQ